MTTVLVAFGTTLATLCLVGLGLWLSRRGNASKEKQTALVVRDLHERMEAMRGDLEQALETAQEEVRRSRFVGELSGSIDLDEVVTRILEAVGELPGVDAAVIALNGTEGAPVLEVAGMTREEADECPVGTLQSGDRLRALVLSYDPAADGDGAILGGVAVPLRGELEPLGVLSVFTRSSAAPISDLAIELEALAVRAGPAIENAKRFREARQLADLDALTSLHNRRYFHETLGREVARAHRYDRRLALILLDLDDFKVVNDRIGHLAGDAVLAEVAERVREVVRSADIACRVGGDEFAVILPESTLEDADQLYARLRGRDRRQAGRRGRFPFRLGGDCRVEAGRGSELVLHPGGRCALPCEGRREGPGGCGAGARCGCRLL
jgi:GGDEF domain-containing protein